MSNGTSAKSLWSDGRSRMSLPIDTRLTEVMSMLRDHQVVIVEAETGAGKTIRLGQAALLHFPEAKVLLTQTRRPAVRWNGKRIAWEMGCQPGEEIGWELYGEQPMTSRRTRLTLKIDQSVANQIRRSNRLPKGVLIVDEAHERSVSTDLLLGLIKQLLPESPETRVIITSATIDTAKFSAYFDNAPVVKVAGRTYPVETQIYRMPRDTHHSSGAANRAVDVLTRFTKGELSIIEPQDADKVLSGEMSVQDAARQIVTRGSVLVLLPGKDDIAQVMSQIAGAARALQVEARVQILAAHSEVSPSEQDAAQADVPEGVIRFVVATEIVRSSVTVPSVVGVIDSLQVKRLITDAKGVAHLQKVAVSKAEADQAKGRAGRTQPGFYIPISFEMEYERLSPWPQPAILREPIASVVLQIAAAGYNIRTFPLIDRPEIQKINIATVRLQKLGALDAQESITEMGELLVQFPVDPERARTFITAERLGVLAEAIVTVAVLEAEGISFRPKDRFGKVRANEEIVRSLVAEAAGSRYLTGEWRKLRPDEVDLTNNLPDWLEKSGEDWIVDCGHYSFPEREGVKWFADQAWKAFAAGTGSDFVAAVRAYRAFRAKERELRDLVAAQRQEGEQSGPKIRVEDALFTWCQQNFLNLKRLRMVQFTIQQIRDEVSSSPLRLQNHIDEQREFSGEALSKALASGLVDFVGRHTVARVYNGPMGEGIEISFSSACPIADVVLIGGVRKIEKPGRRGSVSHILLADMAAPLKPEWLVEVMPQLCRTALKAGSLEYNRATGIVLGTQQTFFGETVIAEQSVQVAGALGVQQFAIALRNEQTGHPCEAFNRVLREEVSELGVREGVSRGLASILPGWYENKLGVVCSLEEALKLDLNLTEEDLSAFLGENYAEYKARVLTSRPDTWDIDGVSCEVKYPYTKNVLVYVPIALLKNISLEKLPAWEGWKVQVYVADAGYRHLYTDASGIAQLAEKAEAYRLDCAWKAFKAAHGDYAEKEEIKYQEAIPSNPSPLVWDEVTGAVAYPEIVFYTSNGGNSTWYWRWFRTEEEANKARTTAIHKWQEVQEAEYERQNRVVLLGRAKELYPQVEAMMESINLEEYPLYGLTSQEAKSRDWYFSQSLSTRLAEAKKWSGLGMFGDSDAQPSRAIETLNELKARLEAALAMYAANTAREPEAREALERVIVAANEIASAYGLSIISWDDKNDVDQRMYEVRQAIEGRRYVEAIEKAEALLQRANEIQKAAEGARKAAELVKELVEREYKVCPVCGAELSADSSHWCQTDLLVSQHPGTEEYVVKESLFQGARVVYLEAVWSSRYSDYKVEMKIDRTVHPTSLEEVETFTRVHLPSQREMEIAQQLRELENELKRIEQEKAYVDQGDSTRLILQVRQEPHPKTKELQWVAGNRTVKYVVNDRSWIQPSKEGEKWICTIGRTLVETPNFRLILVNPQVRIGREREIRQEVLALETELAYLQVQETAEAEETATAPEAAQEAPSAEAKTEEPADTLTVEDAAEALAAAFGKKVKR